MSSNLRIPSNSEVVPVSVQPDQSCGQCGKTASTDVKLSRCIGCHFQAYCGVVCYKQHWPQHKLVCKSMMRTVDPSAILAESKVIEVKTITAAFPTGTAEAPPVQGSGIDFNSIGTQLMSLTQPIEAPEDILSDLEINLDKSLNGEMEKIYAKYGIKYVNWCKLNLKVLMVREACHRASSQIKGVHNISTDIAVTKFQVGLCREKSSVVLCDLARQGIKARILQMTNPDDSSHTHGFIIIDTSKKILSPITSTNTFVLESLLASETPYIIDPLLKWYGPSSEYINSPLFEYNKGLGISGLLECIAQPLQSEVDTILKESEEIYQSAQKILPQVKPNSFLIWKFLKHIGQA